MARTRTLARSLAVIALTACGSADRPAETRPASPQAFKPPAVLTASEPVCRPRADSRSRLCGLAPPRGPVEGGIAYRLTNVVGESFWVVLPDELVPDPGGVATPVAPVGAGLTIMAVREAADHYCGEFPACEPEAVSRESLPNGGILTRWDDPSGSITDLEVSTVALDLWNLVIHHPDAALAERIARAVRVTVDEDLFPRVESTDPGVPLHADWAEVYFFVPSPEEHGSYHLIEILPGCDLESKQPDLGGWNPGPELELHEPDEVAGGRWCERGRYWVDVSFEIDRERLELFHAKLEIFPVE